MSLIHTHSNDVVNLRLALEDGPATTLIKTEHLEVVRLAVDADEALPAHVAPGDMTLECLHGHVALILEDGIHDVGQEQLMFLPAGKLHAVRGLSPSVLLLTIAEPKHAAAPHALRQHHHAAAPPPFDEVQEASEESFPASDPPSHTPVIGS